MKRVNLTLILLLIVFSIACAQSKTDTELNWYTNLEEAKKVALNENKTIFIHFTGSDWCQWCWKLDEEVFEKPAFKDYARDNLVLVKLDFPQKTQQSEEVKKYNRNLAQKYQIRGFPTIQLLTAEGEAIEQTGYREGGAEKYVQHLQNILAKHSGNYNLFQHADFTLKDLHGNSVTLSELDKFIVLDFWATWCDPCKAEIPLLQEIYEKYKDQDLIVVGVSTESVEKQQEFFQQLKENGTEVTYLRLVDSDMAVTREYGIRSIPTTFFIDEDGNIIHQEKGFAPQSATKFENIIENNL
jgi:thiol-disulfide isomerase/thioredoxin